MLIVNHCQYPTENQPSLVVCSFLRKLMGQWPPSPQVGMSSRRQEETPMGDGHPSIGIRFDRWLINHYRWSINPYNGLLTKL
jgi:hypothetical protein